MKAKTFHESLIYDLIYFIKYWNRVFFVKKKKKTWCVLVCEVQGDSRDLAVLKVSGIAPSFIWGIERDSGNIGFALLVDLPVI